MELDEERDRLGRFRLLEPIGQGSMGTVYLGHDPLDDRPVAVKVAREPAHRSAATRRTYRALFFNEMRAASLLSHPNIVEVLDAGVEGERYYIAMEYVDGGHTLARWCRGGRVLPLPRIAEVVLKCALALDHAHRKGVIHRDIKPSNILVSRSGEVKLADFSVALLTDAGVEETQFLDRVGSPLYMSPEQLCDGEVTPQADLFSLGNVLYELLTGRLPFAAETVAGVTHKVLHQALPPIARWREGVPDLLEEVVQRALARDRAQRYASALDLAADLSMLYTGLHDPAVSRAVEGRVDLLRRLAFFAGFRDAEIWELLRWATWEEYLEGHCILTEDQPGDALYVLVQGEVEVQEGAGRVRRLAAGECFGEIDYLAQSSRSATVRAMKPVSVLRLNAEAIARASLDCQVQFQRVFIRTLTERLVHSTEALPRSA